MASFTRETVVERRQTSVRWGAVFAGSFVALGVGLLLQELVVGCGLSAIDPHGGSLGSIGLATSWWIAIVTIVSLFVGGLVGARLSGIVKRGVTTLHGAVIWALTTSLATIFALWAIGSVAATTARTGAAAAQGLVSAGSSALGSGNAGGVLDAVGLDRQQVVNLINQRLAAEGKPAVSGPEIDAAIQQVMNQSVRQGGVDRETIVNALVQHTALSRQDVDQLADQLAATWHQGANQASTKAGNALSEVATGMKEAGQEAGHALLWVTLANFVGLIAALVGGALGAPRAPREREVERREVAVTTPPAR
jgi:hypothetical protein